MSWPDVILTIAVTGLLGVVIFLLIRHTRQAQTELDHLRREVAVFAEASTRVADTLDRVLLGRTLPSETRHSSRRYLLSEAQRAVAQGEALDAVAARLQLSHDEAHLLRYTTPQAPASAAAAARTGAAPGASGGASTATGRSWAA